MDYRQYLVDAAIEEIRRDLGDTCVSQHGTSVQVEGSFRMARVIEAVFTAVSRRSEVIEEEVARTIAPVLDEWEEERLNARAAIGAMCGFIRTALDPLP